MQVAISPPLLQLQEPPQPLEDLVTSVAQIKQKIMSKLSTTIPPARKVHRYQRLSFDESDDSSDEDLSPGSTCLDLHRVISLLDKINGNFMPLVNQAVDPQEQLEVYPQALAWADEIRRNYYELCLEGLAHGVPRRPLTP